MSGNGAGADPSALYLSYFTGSIPDNRESSVVATQAADGFYSIAISSHDMSVGLKFLSVKYAQVPSYFHHAFHCSILYSHFLK